jgi:hypothetical protein
MSPLADKIGLGPTRILDKLPDGTYRLTVVPNPIVYDEPEAISITLTASQVERYRTWKRGAGVIQDLLPDLTPNQREVILTGLEGLEQEIDNDE